MLLTSVMCPNDGASRSRARSPSGFLFVEFYNEGVILLKRKLVEGVIVGKPNRRSCHPNEKVTNAVLEEATINEFHLLGSMGCNSIICCQIRTIC